jgi:hypothetical protein
VQETDPTGTETTTTADPSETTTTAGPSETTTTADPSETTTTAEPTETEEATETAEPTEPTETTEPSEPSEDAEPAEPEVDRAPNPRAYENHHDGKGADDAHADVRGGGSVDHRADKGSQQRSGDEGKKLKDSRSDAKPKHQGKKHG